MSREKRNLLQRTARACADGEGEKNTDTGRAARAALCCCVRSPACGCAACQIYAALGRFLRAMSTVLRRRPLPLLFISTFCCCTGQKRNVFVFWDDVPMHVAEVCRARWTDAWIFWSGVTDACDVVEACWTHRMQDRRRIDKFG